jgi:hypothetical protein
LPLLLTVSTVPPIILAQLLTTSAHLPALFRLLVAGLVGLAGFSLVARLNWTELWGNLSLLRQTLPDERATEPELIEAKV